MIFVEVIERRRILKTKWKEGGYESVNSALTFSEAWKLEERHGRKYGEYLSTSFRFKLLHSNHSTIMTKYTK